MTSLMGGVLLSTMKLQLIFALTEVAPFVRTMIFAPMGKEMKQFTGSTRMVKNKTNNILNITYN